MTRQDTTTPNLDRLRVLLDATDAAGALRETSTDALLTSFATLTHRIHNEQDHGAVSVEHAAAKRAHLADLRAQRDLIRAEVLRRTGDL